MGEAYACPQATIAEEAGFSKGVVYSQFASKADMFLALLEARIAERADQNERLAAGLDGKDLAEADSVCPGSPLTRIPGQSDRLRLLTTLTQDPSGI
jgi:AcrR family transcriptional regulator